jgi:hypothetical protein
VSVEERRSSKNGRCSREAMQCHPWERPISEIVNVSPCRSCLLSELGVPSPAAGKAEQNDRTPRDADNRAVRWDYHADVGVVTQHVAAVGGVRSDRTLGESAQ